MVFLWNEMNLNIWKRIDRHWIHWTLMIVFFTTVVNMNAALSAKKDEIINFHMCNWKQIHRGLILMSINLIPTLSAVDWWAFLIFISIIWQVLFLPRIFFPYLMWLCSNILFFFSLIPCVSTEHKGERTRKRMERDRNRSLIIWLVCNGRTNTSKNVETSSNNRK